MLRGKCLKTDCYFIKNVLVFSQKCQHILSKTYAHFILGRNLN